MIKSFEMYINNTVWSVHVVNSRHASLDTNNGSYLGLTCHDTSDIYIADIGNIHKMKQTFIHELTHAILSSHMLSKEKHYTEEQVAEFVSKYRDLINFSVSLWEDRIQRDYYKGEKHD